MVRYIIIYPDVAVFILDFVLYGDHIFWERSTFVTMKLLLLLIVCGGFTDSGRESPSDDT